MLDFDDNCPAWSNPGQSLPPWPVLADDPDCDGFESASETFMGTLPLAACPVTTDTKDEDPDAWPPDFNDNRRVDIYDVLRFRVPFGSAAGDAAYDPRFDLNMDGLINIFDVLIMRPYFGTECSPP